ncbi:MAG: nitronate monooxygenase [Solirubrobacteraceae bacterium]|nr:nitronate monooxygenase [Solirubrobacteraceae bacterium]
MLDQLSHPIIQAPMAGGVSTPALAAAVSEAGGLGFISAGMLSPDKLRVQLAALRELTDRPFGVNVFSPSAAPGDELAVAEYASVLSGLVGEGSPSLGRARFHDDHYAAKLAILTDDAPAVVSFTFGCPSPQEIGELHDAGAEVWVTVTQVDEAQLAVAAGADAVIAQGSEAGGHRGAWTDDDREQVPTLELVAAIRRALDGAGAQGHEGDEELDGGYPLIAAGGLMTGEHVAQALGAGATAAQLGTAFMLTPEAGTNRPLRRLIAEDRPTAITRAFTGRRARGIVNRWMEQVGDSAPSAYPEVLTLTAPVRTHGLSVGDSDLMSLWAGERHQEARELPAAELVHELVSELTSVGGG